MRGGGRGHERRLEIDCIREPTERDRRDPTDAHRQADGQATCHTGPVRQIELGQDDRDSERPDDAEPHRHERKSSRRPTDLDEHEDERQKRGLGDEQRSP